MRHVAIKPEKKWKPVVKTVTLNVADNITLWGIRHEKEKEG
jgi:hypothetical protein